LQRQNCLQYCHRYLANSKNKVNNNTDDNGNANYPDHNIDNHVGTSNTDNKNEGIVSTIY
jgi:hypothetical protein